MSASLPLYPPPFSLIYITRALGYRGRYPAQVLAMAILVNFILIFALLAAGLACFCVPVLPVWLAIDRLAFARLRKSTRIVVPAILLPSLYALLITSLFLWFTRPAAVFEMAFEFAPTADVTISSAKHNILGDYGAQEVSFIAGRSTINTILLQHFDTTIENSTADDDGKFRFSREYEEFFASETETLTYNPVTSEVRYTWRGFD